MKKTMKKLVGLLFAAVMLFAIAVPTYASEDVSDSACGNPISYVSRLGMASGGNCREQGGSASCSYAVYLDAYRCSPTCHSSNGYCGFVYVCGQGHTIRVEGQVSGYCYH